MTGGQGRVVAAVAALVTGLALVLLVVSDGGRGGYVVRAQFADAGQLVRGNTVEVGGRRVGEVTDIELTDNGLAEVVMQLDDDSVRPLYDGTRAQIRTIGLSGVANRFVDLAPGPPTTREIDDGGVIPTTRTRGVVDLDALMNTVTPEVRKDIRTFVREMAVALTPTTAKQVNGGLEMLNPAVSRLTALGRELTRDEAALRSLLQRTASVSSVLARHRDALGTGVRATAGALSAVATEREALGDALERAPGALDQTARTLRRVREGTLPEVDPFMRAARPAIRPLDELLGEVEPALTNARPLIARMRALMPDARKALEPLPELERAAVPALNSGIKSLKDSLPMVQGLRAYTPDLVAGLVLGFGGSTAGYYDANGHYARVSFHSGPGTATGLFPRPPGDRSGGYRTGVSARCAGAAEEPAADRSNPWHEGAPCDPEDDHG
jgi:phospholipid/cholesterol/gamma-HCH transport system substrate-binding protein